MLQLLEVQVRSLDIVIRVSFAGHVLNFNQYHALAPKLCFLPPPSLIIQKEKGQRFWLTKFIVKLADASKRCLKIFLIAYWLE
jgi:hypothetical protein